MKQIRIYHLIISSLCALFLISCSPGGDKAPRDLPKSVRKPVPRKAPPLKLVRAGYFSRPGLDVMAFSDFYPEGHQGGVTVVQHGVRVAANGDERLEPAPGQWQPVPKLVERQVDEKKQVISAALKFPDEARDRKGFNPIVYPDLTLAYSVRVMPEGEGVKVVVDLDEPLPEAWVGQVGFNLELFPGAYFGKSFEAEGVVGRFPRQLNGPMSIDDDKRYHSAALASGKHLVVAPEDPALRMSIKADGSTLTLLDGRAEHNNGWFIVRSLLKPNRTEGALTWRILPHTIGGWMDEAEIHLSQVGYHPDQKKVAVIELDRRDRSLKEALLYKISATGERQEVVRVRPKEWGEFLRYRYLTFDFSYVRGPGLFEVAYGEKRSNTFIIDDDVFTRHVWQPTLEYFLPVQMCHMRVNDRYRVWHDRCHMDDALMAPVDTNHFDGYKQGPSTLTDFAPKTPVPGLNRGGWHDAGDYDLRVESQIGTVRILSLVHELFDVRYDATTIDQSKQITEMHRPDGVPDVLQQIEHGVLSVLGGYRHLGRLYRGIICPLSRQYTLLGDAATMTDNRVFDPRHGPDEVKGERSGRPDDRLVFTEENPARALATAAGLATAARALKSYRPALAKEGKGDVLIF